MKRLIRCQYLLILTAVLSSLTLTTCHDPLDPSVDFLTYDISQGVIGQGGGLITLKEQNSSLNGSTIEIPEGALAAPTTISLSVIKSTAPGSELSVDVINCEPSGISFNKPVTLKVPIASSIINPAMFYFDPDSSIIRQIPNIDCSEAGYVSTKINHFSRFYVEDRSTAFFDAVLNKTGNTIKATIKFGGKDGLSSIPLKLSYWNVNQDILFVKQFLDKSENKIVGNIKIELLERREIIKYKTLSSVRIALERSGTTPINSKVIVRMVEPVEKVLFSTPNLDSDTREKFFSGSTLVVDFLKMPETGKEYTLRLSWCLSDNDFGHLLKRYTHVYEVFASDDNPYWTVARMQDVDLDQNDNYVKDNYESTIKPVAGFSVDTRTMVSGQAIQFTDLSTNSPTSWIWDFGDNTKSTSQNPIHVYRNVGDYTVKLTATNVYGTHTKTVPDYIKIIGFPKVTTSQASNIQPRSALLGGTITNNGNTVITERGVYVAGNLSVTGQKIPVGSGDGSFSKVIDEFIPERTYYVTAYAINLAGEGRGEQISFTTPPEQQIPVNNGLVAYYPFNGNANDASGNNNNGTVYGATPTVDRKGNPNSAFLFDGLDDYIAINHSASLNMSQQISISFWVKFETSAPYYYPYHIIEKFGCWGTGQRENDLNWGIETANGAFNNFTLNYSFNRYYHIVQVYDGTKIYTYCDGALKGSANANGLLKQNTNRVYISRYNNGGDYFFDGILDDFRIYNRALTQEEVSALYKE